MRMKKCECLAAGNLDWPDNPDNIALNARSVNKGDDDNDNDDDNDTDELH